MERQIVEPPLSKEDGSREKNFDELPELSYEVTKINKYGQKQPRTLRFANNGIHNIRKNKKVSSIHLYSEILKVNLRNLNTFALTYSGEKHEYVYKSPVAMHIVHELKSRLALAKQKKEHNYFSGGEDFGKKHQEKLINTGQLTGNCMPVSRRRASPADRKQFLAKKLQTLLGASEEQRIETAVDSITLDENTIEGKTLKQFCNNFHVLEKSPATLILNIRQFIDQLRAVIMERHQKEFSKLLVEATRQSYTPEDLSLSSVIEHSLEKALIPRFKSRIISCLKHPSKEDTAKLQRNLVSVHDKLQDFFDIRAEFISESGWSAAIEELRAMNDLELPQEQLSAILSTAKTIYNTFNYERNYGREAKQTFFISADDFFPIFLYVVVKSEIEDPLVLCEYLWNLCDPEQLNGEGGYYLTVFGSALEYLKNMDVEELERSRSTQQPLSTGGISTEETGEDINNNNNDKHVEQPSSLWHNAQTRNTKNSPHEGSETENVKVRLKMGSQDQSEKQDLPENEVKPKQIVVLNVTAVVADRKPED